MGLGKTGFTSLLMVLILSLIGCGGIVSAATPSSTNPQIAALSPSTARVASAITLRVVGQNFTPDSEVVWNGTAKRTTFISSNLLLANIGSSDLSQPFTATVYVGTPKSNAKSNNGHVKVVQPLTITSTVLASAVAGSNYSTSLTASGGQHPYTWGAAGQLPPGLTLSSNGSLSGTPTSAGSYSFAVNLNDNSNPELTTSATIQLTVTSGASKLACTSTALPSATAGQPYSATLTASGGTTPYSWSASSTLPPGLSLNSTGTLTGTPTTTGKFSFSTTVKDSSSPTETSSSSYSLSIANAAAPLIIATSSLPGATSGTAYSATLSASGGTSPYTWSATTALPAGLVLASNGTLSGTPTASGSFTIGVKVIDTGSPSQSATATLSLSIAAAPVAALVIKTSALPNGTVGQSYNASFIASGGTQPYAWSATTAIPAGLSLSTGGTLSGTPSSSGSFTLGVKVSDSSSTTKTATASVTLTVAAATTSPLAVTSTSVPAATSGSAYSYSLSANGGKSPYTWSLAGGQLPAGVALSSAGTLSGTPSSTGTYGFTAQVTDSSNSTASASLSLSVTSAASSGVASPNLPKAYVDTTYPSSSGSVIAVHAGGDLQAALDSAQPGDQVVLDAGATFTGNFILRKKIGQDSNTNYIIIRSSGTLPAQGTRVSPSNASSMAKVQSNNTAPALQTEFGAHHYRIVGVELTKVPDPAPSAPQYTNVSYGIIFIGGPSISTGAYATTASDLPHHIVFDRCYIHGDYSAPHGETYRAIMLNANYGAVIDSYISNIHSEYQEVQGVEGGNSFGPLKIVNNYVESSGENIMFGGYDPSITNLIPADVEIRHNYVSKPMSWNPSSPSYAGVNYLVKNLMEFKNAIRVLADGNIFEHNWVNAQNGTAILLTPRNQAGTCDWCAVQDITFTNNIVRATNHVFNITGSDGPNPNVTRSSWLTQQTQRVMIKNNLFYDVGGALWNPTPGNGYGIFIALAGGGVSPYTPVQDFTVEHNTAFTPYQVLSMANPPAASNFRFANNLVTHGVYGIFGDATGEGSVAFNAFTVNDSLQTNVMIGGTSMASYYPAAPVFNWTADTSGVGFTDYTNCSGGSQSVSACTLTSSSPFKGGASDGTDVGVNTANLGAATSCTLSGVQCQ